ncbi:hypothetical protein F2P79_018201 [Pimephales promelas]|nr:hypothetical protein F2P79_018201 [Pimephales promelas]
MHSSSGCAVTNRARVSFAVSEFVSLPPNCITARLNRTDSPFSAYWSVFKDMRWFDRTIMPSLRP